MCMAGSVGADSDGAQKQRKKKERGVDEKDAPVKIKGLSLAPKKEEEDDETGMDRPRVRIVEEQRKMQQNAEAARKMKEQMAVPGVGSSADGHIPTQDDIERLKARRELARKHGTADGGRMGKEFIPLQEGAKSESRMARDEFAEEEDDIVADDTGNEAKRMTFGQGGDEKKSKRAEISAHLAAGGLQAGMDLGSSGDEKEVKEEEGKGEWEDQQEKKGTPVEKNSVASLGETKVKAGVHQMKSMEEVQKTLKSHLERMKEQRVECAEKLEECTARVTRSQSKIHEIEGDMKGAQTRYTFFQDTRTHLEDLLAMLDTKAPLMEDLEDELQEARSTRAMALRKRRQANFNDEYASARQQVRHSHTIRRIGHTNETECDGTAKARMTILMY